MKREIAAAKTGLACLAIEGEPGIGKTRFVLAIEELARQEGFVTAAVTADEEIRGPFLLARSIFGSLATADSISGAPAKQAVQRALDALSSIDDPSLQSLAPDRKMVRVFDLAAVALRALAAERPVAVLMDDVQWADEDSLRMLRYVIRTNPSSRTLVVLATRPNEVAFVNEAVTLMADVDRMGLLRRIRLSRFSQMESTDFLQQVLNGKVNLTSAAVMHAQAEGVPFILAEQAQAYRDSGLIQQIDGVWTLARNADRLLPSGVRTLIQRRAARLPEATRACLGEAAVLGRSFSLRDLREVKTRLGDDAHEIQQLAEALAPAVAAGLLNQGASGAPVDYRFTHEGVREYAVATLSPTHRRALHETVIQMLSSGGETPESLPLIAQHALAAGRTELCARASIEAARNALQANAAEEALRLVGLAQPVATSAQDRIALLQLQDDAFEILRQPARRLEGLAQLAALADALRDSHLQLEVMLRRAAALRLSKEYTRAAELARQVRTLAVEKADKRAELSACLELGQNLLQSQIGDSFNPTASEVDLDGAGEAYECALSLAEELGDEARVAAVNRELGVIAGGRVRAWFISKIPTGEMNELMGRLVAGERMEDIFPSLPIAPIAHEATARLKRALELYERLSDRKGTMSTIIAMAFLSWGPELHTASGAKRIEEIRRLASRINSLTKESERAQAEAQMLFGAHVYARAKGIPDAALAKGQETYTAARAIGDRSVEFAAAGGMAGTFAELGAVAEAEQWLGRAATVASTEPTPLRARLLETWRGMVRAVALDAAGMREHLERALQLATEQGRPAARCEALARLALEAARLGAERKDKELLALAERSAQETLAIMPQLAGHPPWGAQAHAALTRVALARGDHEAAAAHGRAAMAALQAAKSEDAHLDVVLPAAEGMLAGGSEQEKSATIGQLQFVIALLVPRILDERVRVQWLRGPVGRDLTRLAGPMAAPAGAAAHVGVALSEQETILLQLMIQGHTNREIADETHVTDESVARQLAGLFAKIGASSRAEATTFALVGKLV